MSPEINVLRRRIKRSLIIYIIGCFCFAAVALMSIWFGYYLIRHYGENDLPAGLIIFSLAGILLLWEMSKAFRFKASLPESFKPVTSQEYPALFRIITEVTTALDLSPIRKVYICPDATAAVFTRPRIWNILTKAERNLVVGMGFLTQMDDDEIRAMLYHEFGHYVQKEMKDSVSVYTIGQFSRSFVTIRNTKKQGTWETQMKMQLLMFTYFTIWICDRINESYSQLAKQMEYDADDVAAKYMGVPALQRALVHAACIRYNYEAVQWGLKQLELQNIGVDNIYQALRFVGSYSRPSRRMLPEEVIRRVERFGQLADSSVAENSVQQSALLLAQTKGETQHLCPAFQFARWLREGFVVYTRQKSLQASVDLEICLERRKHKLPFFDGKYNILLDGKAIGEGNFRKGYTLRRKTSPGKHTITASAPSGIFSTPFEFEAVQDKAYRIEMDYKAHLNDGVYDVFGKSISEFNPG